MRENRRRIELNWSSERENEPDVLDGRGVGEERVEDSDGLGPVARAAELGELDPLGDSCHFAVAGAS